MNRKERRAAARLGRGGEHPPGKPSNESFADQLLASAVDHHRAGRLPQAESAYRQILALDPCHLPSLHGLSQIAHHTGRSELALDFLGQALAVNERLPELHYALAAVLHATGRLPEAATHCARAAQLRPDFAQAWFGLGNVLAAQGRLGEAADRYRRAVAVQPNYAEALTNLGGVLYQLGEIADAIKAWERAITAAPSYPVPRVNLGVALADLGRYEEAIAQYRQALALHPDDIEALSNLAKAQLATGNVVEALLSARRAVAIGESEETTTAFVSCLQQCRFTSDLPDVRDMVMRALSAPWARPHHLAGPAADLAKRAPHLAACVARLAAAWPRRLRGDGLWSPAERSAVCNDPLLRVLLDCAPVCDLDLERFLTNVRLALLDDAEAAADADPALLEFYAALARQCFINEYVFGCGEDELGRWRKARQDLSDALEAGAEVPPLQLVAVAAYGPLHALARAPLLLDRTWPSALQDLLRQQIAEPREEASLRAAVPVLTPIDDAVSRAVQEQYEENPYPRWIKAPAAVVSDTVEGNLRRLFPSLAMPPLRDDSQGCDILVAGCGTGQQSIEMARRFRGARVLAIDLSLTSLGYAVRKTRELGLHNIDYGQADILAASSLRRSFDIITASGVLHHLADPFAGWRALLALLRPGGLMSVALYSEIARRDLAGVRALIAERGYRRNADDIRRFRQDILTQRDAIGADALLRSPDVFSTSGCRDLLFHVQESCLTIPQIAAFLQDNELAFLGFALAPSVLQQFRQEFGETATTDLACWHAFETARPESFGAMYHFWVQGRR